VNTALVLKWSGASYLVNSNIRPKAYDFGRNAIVVIPALGPGTKVAL
jgi:hypothetical protein